MFENWTVNGAQYAFLLKIQNRINRETRKKNILLHTF
jgi:hypothetical protein